MQLHEKIHLMRTIKGLSQEDIAEKLGITANGYGKIERGETDIQWSRLQQIADVLDITIKELVSLGDNAFLNLNLGNIEHYQNNNIAPEQVNLYNGKELELEKINLLLKQKDKEILLLEEQVMQLKEIISLMKQSK